jgi:hypothetical protein
MNPDVYAGWITRAYAQRASSTSTANLPTIDSHDAIAQYRALSGVAASPASDEE